MNVVQAARLKGWEWDWHRCLSRVPRVAKGFDFLLAFILTTLVFGAVLPYPCGKHPFSAAGNLNRFLRKVTDCKGKQTVPEKIKAIAKITEWLAVQPQLAEKRQKLQRPFKDLVQHLIFRAKEYVADSNLNAITPETDLSESYREREADYAIEGEIMGDLTEHMWRVLVDWLIEVQVSLGAPYRSWVLRMLLAAGVFGESGACMHEHNR